MESLGAPNLERRKSRPVAVAVAILLAAGVIAGCGGDEDEGAAPPPPPESESTGVPGDPPAGAPDYEGLGSWWTKLPDERRLASAAEFIDANQVECEGLDPVDLERQTGIAYGYDFPEAARVSEVMLETCALLRDGA